MPTQEARLLSVLRSERVKRVNKDLLVELLEDIRKVVGKLIGDEEFARAETLIDALLDSWVCDTHDGYQTHLELVMQFNKGIARRNIMAMQQLAVS